MVTSSVGHVEVLTTRVTVICNKYVGNWENPLGKDTIQRTINYLTLELNRCNFDQLND